MISNELTLVSFELAKLLKDVGFDWGCEKHYYLEDNGLPNLVSWGVITFYKLQDVRTPAPTLDLAQKWFRDVHNIEVEVGVYHKLFDEKLGIDYNKLYSALVSYDEESALREAEKEYNLILKISNLETYTNQMIMELIKNTFFKTYEEALEIGIQKACEYLIEKQKENG